MSKYELALDKYRLKQSGYFRHVTTVELGMGITDTNILLCYDI